MPTPDKLATDARVAVLIANGLEEVEALAVVDVLYRAGIAVDMLAVGDDLSVTSSHRVTFRCDALLADVDLTDYALVFLPGGVPGTPNLKSTRAVTDEVARRLGEDLPLAAVCAAALAGCSSFPMSSAPEPFDVSSRDNGVVQFAADGPSDGADPVSLVKDFLRACAAGTNDDYATARLFLTESSASNWKPEEEVLVHESDTENTPTIAPRDGDDDSDSAVMVTVSFTAIASVDSVGILTHSPHTTIDQEYSLVRKEGQWRIESPADVVVMSRSAFTASYQLANLYFPAATQDALVADPRWLPSRRLAGHLLDGLAKGPRPSLAAAVVNAIAAHHGDVEPESLVAWIVAAADAISAARPGARRESLEAYTERLQQLEDITKEFKGVDNAYAIQAGREIRVSVVPEQISDADMVLLARNIAKRIESELDYPGQIKVNLVRESRVSDVAK